MIQGKTGTQPTDAEKLWHRQLQLHMMSMHVKDCSETPSFTSKVYGNIITLKLLQLE